MVSRGFFGFLELPERVLQHARFIELLKNLLRDEPGQRSSASVLLHDYHDVFAALAGSPTGSQMSDVPP